MDESPSTVQSSHQPLSLKDRLISKWNSITKKQKFIFIYSLVFIIILLILLLIRILLQIQNPNQPQSNNQLPLDQGNYEKLVISQRKPTFFTLKAKTTNKYGILPSEEFILKTQNAIPEDFLRKNLKTTSPVTIKKVDNTTYTLTPDSPIATDSLYEIKLLTKDDKISKESFDRDYGWAFQTQGKFRVVSSIPGNKKTNVPTNTGIEITFSQDGFQNANNYISITPKLDYRLEYHAETLAIVPNNKLTEATLYTVTLKKGLNLKSRNDPLAEDFIFSFQTEVEKKQTNKPYLTITKNLQQIATNEKAEFKVYTYDWDGSKVKANIYQFPDSGSFINSRKVPDESYRSWYSYYPENVSIDLTKLSLLSKADLAIESQNDVKFIRLPTTLPAGFYLVQIEYGEKKHKEYVWLQSTNLSGFLAGGTKKSTVWTNSLDDGKPQANVTVQAEGVGNLGVTNDQGINIFDTPQTALNQPGTYIKLIKDEKELYIPFYTSGQQAKKTKEDYWTYLYHERTLYKPDDTIYFWGIVKERDTNSSPSRIKVSISNSRYYYETGESYENDLKSIDINPEADGTFIGSISYTNLPPSWYNLRVQADGINVISSGFSIENYTKPDIKINVTSAKKAVFSGESIKFKAQVAFYDNTPVSNISLKTFERYGANPGELKTNNQGELDYTLKPAYDPYSLYYYACATFTPAAAVEKTIEGNGCVLSFNNRVILDSNSNQESTQANFQVQVNNIDLDKYNKNPDQGYTGKPAAGQKGELNIYKYWYTKTPSGTFYDFIEKITKPKYDFKRNEEQILKTTLTADDTGKFNHKFALEPDKSYRATLTVTDSDGHKQEITEYFYAYNRHEDNITDREFPELLLNKKDNLYGLNEDVQLKIQLGDKLYTDTKENNFLFLISARGMQEAIVSESPQLTFAFSTKHLPNSFASAVIFTGKGYTLARSSCLWEWRCIYGSYYNDYSLPSINFAYKQEDKNLKFDLSFDKTNYLPGDDAEITVTVKNKDGQLASDTQVQLVLVDEAMEAIGGVNLPSPLSSLYKYIDSGIYFSYYSHQSLFPDESGAEKGGGGGGEERNIFKDTAYFSQARTNAEGKTVFRVKLPDNITSWIVFAQAYNDKFEAGHTRTSMITTKDFFVFPAFMSEVLTADKPKLTSRSYGTALNNSLNITYSAEFRKDKTVLYKSEKKAKAYEPVLFEFPKLSTGVYSLALHGSTGNKKDTVSLPYSVISSRFSFEKQNKTSMQNGSTLKAPDLSNILKDKPVNLYITDSGKGIYYYDLVYRCYGSSNRIEKKLSQLKAKQILVDLYKETDCADATESLQKFQTENGGISLVQWGGDDLPVSAWAASVNPEIFNRERMLSYFGRELQNTPNDRLRKIYAAWGLQSIGKPMLNVLRQYGNESVTIMEKTISGIALAQNGDTETARNLYYDILAEYAYISKPYIRIQFEKATVDELIKNSSLVLLLGALVEPEYNEGLYLYVRDFKYDTQDIVLDLAEIKYIENQLAKLPKEFTEMTYTSSVRTIQKKFENQTAWNLRLANEELNNFRLSVQKGKADVMLTYSLGVNEFKSFSKDKRLTLDKTYTNLTDKSTSFKPGDIVRVKLSFNFASNDSPRGQYTVTDILPSGLVYIENPTYYAYQTDDWVQSAQNNRIIFSIFNDPGWLKYNDKNLVYYARVAGSGTFKEEPALMQSNLDLSVLTYTDLLSFTSK